MTHKSHSELLEEYSKSLGLLTVMSLEELISSHNDLRNMNVENCELWNKKFQEGYAKGKEQGITMILEHEYIKIEKLKSMSVGQMADFLAEPQSY